jgi:hypothetical protein
MIAADSGDRPQRRLVTYEPRVAHVPPCLGLGRSDRPRRCHHRCATACHMMLRLYTVWEHDELWWGECPAPRSLSTCVSGAA